MFPAGFRGAAKRLDDIDIPRIGAAIGVGEDEVRAIMEVESRGAGFDRQGRPLILFEPHIFWRELGPGKKRDQAAKAGLAYQRWKRDYPKDSYPRLAEAIAIDEAAALKSASWGLGQIMGGNFAAAGYSSVQEMVSAFCADEEAHLAAMINFIKKASLDDEIRAHNWAGFARGYNGPGYAQNQYDQRLAKAFSKWKAKPDIPFDISMAAHEDEAHSAKAKAPNFVDAARVKAVQQRLKDLNYQMVGNPDGIAGARTAAAIAAFETENGYPVTGQINDELIARLEAAEPHEPSAERAAAIPTESRVLDSAKKLGLGALGLGGSLGIDSIPDLLDKAEAAKGIAERIRDFIAPLRGLIADNWKLLLFVGAGFLLFQTVRIGRARIEDHRSGKTP